VSESLLDQLSDEVKTASLARIAVAEKWTGAVTICVFVVCLTALGIAILALR
jgi:hypothetical protein